MVHYWLRAHMPWRFPAPVPHVERPELVLLHRLDPHVGRRLWQSRLLLVTLRAGMR